MEHDLLKCLYNVTRDTPFAGYVQSLSKTEAARSEGLLLLTRRSLDLLEIGTPRDSSLGPAIEALGGTSYRIGLHNGYGLWTATG